MEAKKYILLIFCCFTIFCVNAQSIKQQKQQQEQKQQQQEQKKRQQQQYEQEQRLLQKEAELKEQSLQQKALLSVDILIELFKKGDMGFVDEFLTNRAWFYEGSCATWSFDKNKPNSLAKAWLSFYNSSEHGDILSYRIANKDYLTEIENSMSAKGFNKVDTTNSSEHGLQTRYRDNQYEIIFSKMEESKNKEDDEIRFEFQIFKYQKVKVWTPPVQTIEDEEVVEEEIFMVVASQPEFPGGDKARMKFLQDNLKYPQLAKNHGIQGTVYVSFVVEKDGSITDIQVVRSIDGCCDEEAIRVIKAMPKWKAGQQKSGKSVRVRYNLGVKFSEFM